MSLSSQILQLLISGITVGVVYGLVAVGFNIIYNATGIINFAQGEFVMLGGMSAVWLDSLGVPMYFTFPLAVLMVTCVGIIMERVAIRPLKKADVLGMIISTIGASILFKGLAMLIWGKSMHPLPHFSSEEPLSIFGATFLWQDVWVLALAAVIVFLLWIFFEKTLLGKAIRACAFNKAAASLVGINVTRMVMVSFAISAAVGAAAGEAITPKILVSYDRGTMLALKGFAAAILGGLGNSFGGVFAGIIIGVMESLTAGFVSSHYKDAVALVVLLGVLFVKPSGIFGKSEVGKLKKF